MANAAAMINEGLWRKDRDFQRLPRLAQCTFCQVLSQKDLDTAGGLTLNMDLLAKACDELTVEQLVADFAVLEERRFIFVDYETDELLVRSYVRLVSAVGGPKNRAWLSVPKNARMIASPKIRHELAVELRRLRRKEADDLADEIDPLGTPPEPPRNPLGTPSENGTPFEGSPNPPSSVQVSVLESLPAVGHLGEHPRPECHDHEENSDEPCIRCQRRREWDKDHAAELKAAESARARADELDARRRRNQSRQKAIDDCLICGPDGFIDIGDDLARKCGHHA